MKQAVSLNITQLQVCYQGALVGTLTQTPERLAAFQYDTDWLQNGFSISPFSLPLEEKVFVAQAHPLDGLFGIFADSMPDGWGRLLVDRMLKEQSVDPNNVGFLTRLAIVGQSGAGALEYKPAVNLAPSEQQNDLDALAQDCSNILAARDAQDLDALFEMGGSSGGARPKVFYLIDGEEWIVKFPSSVDSSQIGVEEFAIAKAAKEFGLEMADVRLLPSNRCPGYFATKRFDRITYENGSEKKIHMASVAALLETSHRIPNLDYDLLLRLTLKLTNDATQVERMYKHMVFNVLCGNRDDHSKNFSFLFREEELGSVEGHAEGHWQLSPAYDLTNNSGMNGERSTTVNGKGRDITKADMLEVAKRAGIKRAFAEDVIERAQAALSSVLGKHES
jgi:serine/threonine-protein kinase HipA